MLETDCYSSASHRLFHSSDSAQVYSGVLVCFSSRLLFPSLLLSCFVAYPIVPDNRVQDAESVLRFTRRRGASPYMDVICFVTRANVTLLQGN